MKKVLYLLLILMFSQYNYESDIESKMTQKSSMDPHSPGIGKTGPWSEGWYYRITDHENNRVIACIGGIYLSPETEYEPGIELPGYIAILISTGSGGPLTVYEAFPENIIMYSHGEPVSSNPGYFTPADFEWKAEGFGTITQDYVDLNIPGVVELQADFSNRIPWMYKKHASPEGLLAFLPDLPLHWYVYSLGSETDYEITIFEDDEEIALDGNGYAHQEKNWANSFPGSWIWTQGVNEDNTVQYVLSGGVVDSGSPEKTLWIVGYFSENLQWDFRGSDLGTSFETNFDACSGTFNLTAKNPLHTLIINVKADLNTFNHVAIPTEEGFKSDAVESFEATTTIEAYIHYPFGGLSVIEKLVEKRVLHNASLEFGGDYQCGE